MTQELQRVVTVNDKEYTIQIFKGETSMVIFHELSRVIIPFIKDLQDAFTTEDEAEKSKMILSALEKVFTTVDYNTALKLLKTLVSQVYGANGRVIVPNDEFAKNITSWYLLAWEVISFNYADVFSFLGSGETAADLNRDLI
ncbi:tail assembly chaperone protein [Acinetobacter phage AM24]|nr:tail assembly chaperone protein [Acinetobacter phage AM24]